MKRFFWMLFFMPMSGLYAQGCPLCASLEIKVLGLKSNQGIVRVLLTRDAASFEELDPSKIEAAKIYFRNLPAKKEGVVIKFPELPSGDYAYKIFHDENNNEILDTTLLGKPVEAVAISGYGALKSEKVSFSKAKFKLAPREKLKKTQNLNL